jgi:hypothetical protein
LKLGKQVVLRGKTLQTGITGSVDGTFNFVAPTGRFTSGNIGQVLVVGGSALAVNNQEVTVSGVLSPTTLMATPNLQPDTGPLVWELKETVPVPPNQVTVEVRAGDVSGVDPGWILKDGSGAF